MAEGMGGKIAGYVQEHPGLSIAIGAGGLVFVLWIFGAFSKGGGGGDGGQTSMAAAYYAAEAQQAVVGGQIQVATLQATRDTAIAGLQADAATKINKTNAKAAMTINQQNADTSVALGGQQLLATYNNNATSLATTNSNNATALSITDSNNRAGLFQTLFGTTIPAELSLMASHGYAPSGTFNTPYGRVDVALPAGSPAAMAAAGFNPAQIASYWG
jgi:hypothetical protein